MGFVFSWTLGGPIPKLSEVSGESKSASAVNDPTWQLIAVFIGFVSTADQFVSLVKRYILQVDTSPKWVDGCLIAGYFLFLIWASAWILFKYRVKRDPQKDEHQDLLRHYNRIKIIQAFRSFGLSLVRDWILNSHGVLVYDGFSRPYTWPPKGLVFKHVDRFTFRNITVEYQYPTDYSEVEVRTAAGELGTFSDPEFLPWSKLEYKWLTFCSWTGIWWTFRHWLEARIFSEE